MIVDLLPTSDPVTAGYAVRLGATVMVVLVTIWIVGIGISRWRRRKARRAAFRKRFRAAMAPRSREKRG